MLPPGLIGYTVTGRELGCLGVAIGGPTIGERISMDGWWLSSLFLVLFTGGFSTGFGTEEKLRSKDGKG